MGVKEIRQGKRGSNGVALRHINPCMLLPFYFPQGGVSSGTTGESRRRRKEEQEKEEACVA